MSTKVHDSVCDCGVPLQDRDPELKSDDSCCAILEKCDDSGSFLLGLYHQAGSYSLRLSSYYFISEMSTKDMEPDHLTLHYIKYSKN